MWTKKLDGNMVFLTQWRLCCVCCRMMNTNATSHLIGHCGGLTLFSHFVCPPDIPKEDITVFERRLE